jgi:hypothetical protein
MMICGASAHSTWARQTGSLYHGYHGGLGHVDKRCGFRTDREEWLRSMQSTYNPHLSSIVGAFIAIGLHGRECREMREGAKCFISGDNRKCPRRLNDSFLPRCLPSRGSQSHLVPQKRIPATAMTRLPERSKSSQRRAWLGNMSRSNTPKLVRSYRRMY